MGTVARRAATAILGTMLLAGASAAPAAAVTSGDEGANHTGLRAAAAGWDFVGRGTFFATGNGDYKTSAVRSTGGDFQGCIGPIFGSGDRYELWEWDSENTDDYVGSVRLNSDGCAVFRSIGGFVDGSDGTAEFYLVTTAVAGTYADYYD
ncbi:hypothetical protein OOK36_45000 [Streptomyces sp. NBC_00365]|uniref:hypothetical protein n=1 Tax=Streptomyces sp. NBC_00365 TaxID=2975726 RepID=UPI0022590F4C|nr:hypothetical protein [Streptomyces sp. NBC_00365]MCX5095850.1 hypothetical protein [Streptomyces sp. NBC_00365]